MKKATLALTIISALALTACQKDEASQSTEEAQAAQASQAAEQDPYETEVQQQSYALGANMGLFIQNRLEQQKTLDVDSDVDALIEGFKDGVTNQTVYSIEKIQAITKAAESSLRAKMIEQENAAKAENLAIGEAYLAKNATKEGVMVTESGLQYEVIVAGEGASPEATDKVKVHYKGALVDGTEFDSSYKRGVPAEFRLDGVIDGWTEGLQLMQEGATYRFHVPAVLAYGEYPKGPIIGPNSTLVFDVELLEVLK